MRLEDERRFREASRERNAERMIADTAERFDAERVTMTWPAMRELLAWVFDQGLAEARLRHLEGQS